MDLSSFIAQLPGAGARNNLFRVIVPFPTYAVVGGETTKLAFLAKGAQIPESTLGIIDVPFRGRKAKLAGDRTFDQGWQITVINDTDFMLRDAFERWSNGINSHEGNVGRTNVAEYSVDATVEQLDKNDNTIKVYTFHGAWPSEIGNIELNYETQDAIEEFTVMFQYSHWSARTTD